jgi:hypothetical protein
MKVKANMRLLEQRVPQRTRTNPNGNDCDRAATAPCIAMSTLIATNELRIPSKAISKRIFVNLRTLYDISLVNVRFFEPMLCLAVPELPEGPEWQLELKLESYRGVGIKSNAQTRLGECELRTSIGPYRNRLLHQPVDALTHDAVPSRYG